MALTSNRILTEIQQKVARVSTAENEHYENMEASEKVKRCAQLCRLVVEGGYRCFSKLFQVTFTSPAELYQHLRSPNTEKQLRRIKVQQLLKDDDFHLLYTATESDLDNLFYHSHLDEASSTASLTQYGHALKRLLLLLKYVVKPGGDEEFDSEIQVFREFRKQASKIADVLVAHSPLVAGKLNSGPMSYKEASDMEKRKVSFKQCWQHIVLFYRHIVKLVEDFESLDSSMCDSESLRVAINRLLKALKHGQGDESEENSEDLQLSNAIEIVRDYREWANQEQQIELLEIQMVEAKLKGTKDLRILTEPLLGPRKNGVTFGDEEGAFSRSLSMASLSPSHWNEIKNGMDFEKRSALAMHYDELTKEVKSDMVIDQLVSKRIFTIRESSVIFSTANSEAQMQILLNLLVRKEPDIRAVPRSSMADDTMSMSSELRDSSLSVRDGFDELLDAIKTRHQTLTDRIREDYGKLVADSRALSYVAIDSNMEHVRQTLKAYYERSLLCSESPFPLHPQMKLKLSQFYVPLQLAYPGSDCLVNIRDMFTNQDPSRSNRWIVVEGESGIGKSTFAKHILDVWARQVKSTEEQNQRQSPAYLYEAVNATSNNDRNIENDTVPFDLVVYIDLRAIQVSNANTTTKMHALMVDQSAVKEKKRSEKKKSRKKSAESQPMEKLDAKTVLIDQLVAAQQFLHTFVQGVSSRQAEKAAGGHPFTFDKSKSKPDFDEEDEENLALASQYAKLVRGKLSFRDFAELIEDNQNRVLIIIDNYEPAMATLPMSFHGEFHQDGAICAVVDSLIYGTYLPEATVMLLSSPHFMSALKDQYDARFVLCGFDNCQIVPDSIAPNVQVETSRSRRKVTRDVLMTSAADTIVRLDIVNTAKTQFLRNYCHLTNANMDNFNFLLKMIDRFCTQSNLTNKKREEREDSTQYTNRDVVDAITNLVANRRHGHFTPLLLVHTYTRVPLFFTMLITIIEVAKKAEQIGASKLFNLSQTLISLFNASNTNSALFAQNFLIDQFVSSIKFNLSLSGLDDARRVLVNRTFQYLQETAFRQLVQPCGGMTEHVVNRLQKLQQAQTTQMLTSLSQNSDSPSLFVGVSSSPTSSGPTVAEIETLYLASNQTAVRDLIALSGLLKAEVSSGGDQLDAASQSLLSNDARTLFSAHYVFKNRLVLEFLAARYLDGSINSLLNIQSSVPTQSTNTDDIRKFFLGLLQNTYWVNVVLYFANMKSFGQNAVATSSPVSAEGSGSLKYFFEALSTLSKYRLLKYAKAEASQKSPSPTSTGFGFSSSLGTSPVESNSGRLANLNLQMSLLMMSSSPGSDDAPTGVSTIMQQGKRAQQNPAQPQLSKIHVQQLQLLFDCYNLVSVNTSETPTPSSIENTYFKSCIEALPPVFIVRNTGIFSGLPKRKYVGKAKSKDVIIPSQPMVGDHGSSNQISTLLTINGMCLALESRYSRVTTLEVELSRLNKQNNETLFYRLAESIALLNLRPYFDSVPKVHFLPPIAAPNNSQRATPASLPCTLRVLKIYWSNVDFLSKFLLLCFKRSADVLLAARKAKPETKKQQEMAALENARRFAIEKLKCVYQPLRSIQSTVPEYDSSKWSRQMRAALECLTVTRQLESFSFKACPKPMILSCVLHALPVTDSLHRLDFGACKMQLQHASDLAHHLHAKNIHVHVLKLAGIKFDVLTFNHFVRCLVDNKSITFLSLSRCPPLDKLQMVALNEVLMLNTHLETLCLEEIPFNKQACESLVQILKLNSGLRLVKLTNTLIDPEGAKMLQQYLASTIRKLRIDGI